jgi:hypothetical protein
LSMGHASPRAKPAPPHRRATLKTGLECRCV